MLFILYLSVFFINWGISSPFTTRQKILTLSLWLKWLKWREIFSFSHFLYSGSGENEKIAGVTRHIGHSSKVDTENADASLPITNDKEA
jgi:hypothetical protein